MLFTYFILLLSAALVCKYMSFLNDLFSSAELWCNAGWGEILDVMPDANEQDVRKQLLATGSVEETLDWMLEQQSNYVHKQIIYSK